MQRSLEIILTFIDRASPGMAAAANAVRSAFSGLGSSTTNVTGMMTTAWQATGGKVVGALNDIIAKSQLASLFVGGAMLKAFTDAVEMAGKFERFGKAAEAMTGSADAANKLAASVRSLARETLFNIDQLADLESKLIGNTKSVEQSDKALRSLANAVQATGGEYSELEGATRAYIQVNSKAKVSSEELNRQFANANIPIVRLLAESIEKDANHPLRKYIETVGSGGSGAVGASKKLTTAFQGASDQLPILAKRSEAAEKRLQSLKDAGKAGSASFLSAEASVMSYHQKLDKAQDSIKSYTAAQGKQVVATKKVKLTTDEIMAQLQEIGDLNIPGKVGAEAIIRALDEAYGDKSKALINTFSYQFDKLKDNLKLTALTFLGIDSNFKVVEGGILSLITKALVPMNDWLEKNEKSIMDFAKSFGGSLPGLMTLAGILGGALLGAFSGIIVPMVIVSTVFGSLGYAVGRLIEMNGGFIKTLQDIQNGFSTLVGWLQQAYNWFLANQNTLETIGIVILTIVGPAILRLAGLFAIEMITALIANITTYAQLIAKMAMFVFESWMMITALGIKIGQFIIATTVMIAHTIATIALNTWTLIVTASTWLFNVALAVLASPITLVIVAIVALIATIILLAQNWDYISAKSKEVWNTITNYIRDHSSEIRTVIFGLLNFISGGFLGLASQAFGWGKGIIQGVIDGIKSAARALGSAGNKILESTGFGNLKFQHGGIVPGAIGQAVPIIAHGGERITPATGVDGGGGGGGNTVNFYGNISVDSDERVKQLADQISKILGRQNELARYGAGY